MVAHVWLGTPTHCNWPLIVAVSSTGASELYYSYFKSCNSATPTAMGQSKSLSLDPEEPIQFMNNFDRDFSDDFEWYIDEDECLEEKMSRQIRKIEVETVLWVWMAAKRDIEQQWNGWEWECGGMEESEILNGVVLELEIVHCQRRWSWKWATWRASCDWITDWSWTQRVSCVFRQLLHKS